MIGLRIVRGQLRIRKRIALADLSDRGQSGRHAPGRGGAPGSSRLRLHRDHALGRLSADKQPIQGLHCNRPSPACSTIKGRALNADISFVRGQGS